MSVFSNYASYYDLLYRDKSYAEEAAFVLEKMARLGTRPHSLLDLGCGTARHALALTREGVAVTGVDMSETMLRMGNSALRSAANEMAAAQVPTLVQGDARTVRLGCSFEAVTSLFHVMSYQATEEDALSVLHTAYEHLDPGGLFLFDFWHGPGVLTDPPVRRNRVLEDEHIRVYRLAEPEARVSDDVVVVHYTIDVLEKATGVTSQLREAHAMRYWFLPELRYLAGQAGFEVLHAAGWMHDDPPGLSDWNAWMITRKKA